MKALEIIEIILGSNKAKEVRKELKSGERTTAEVNEWAEKLGSVWKKSQNCADIDENNWRDFEDGWRPDR